jgi:hypothetical protein
MKYLYIYITASIIQSEFICIHQTMNLIAIFTFTPKNWIKFKLYYNWIRGNIKLYLIQNRMKIVLVQIKSVILL